MEQATCAGTAKALSDLTTPSQIETKGEDIVVIEDSDSESDDDSDDGAFIMFSILFVGSDIIFIK